MVTKLKRRIILLSSFLSILVMLLVIVISFLMAKEQEERYQQEFLAGHVNNIVKMISLTGKVENMQLENLRSNGVYVYLEDLGRPLLLSESYNQDIIGQIKEAASEQGVDLWDPWNSTTLTTSFLYSLQSRGDVRVFVQQVPSTNATQFVTLIAFQNRAAEKQAIRRLSIVYGLLGVASAAALILISWFLAGIAVGPTKESLRLQKEFISAASHELRTPLAVIKSSLAAMVAKPAEQERFTSVIHNEVERLARLTDDLSQLGDSGTAAWTVQKDAVNPDTVLIGLYESYLPLAAHQNHKLTLCLPEETLPAVQADEKRIVQLLSILLNNAISHTDAGTEIIMGGSCDGRKLTLSVSDNGAGIAKEYEKKIFQRFYRIDQSRRNKMHFGLGLSIAQEIAEKHDGKLIYTPTEGGGSTFAFTIKL